MDDFYEGTECFDYVFLNRVILKVNGNVHLFGQVPQSNCFVVPGDFTGFQVKGHLTEVDLVINTVLPTKPPGLVLFFVTPPGDNHVTLSGADSGIFLPEVNHPVKVERVHRVWKCPRWQIHSISPAPVC